GRDRPRPPLATPVLPTVYRNVCDEDERLDPTQLDARSGPRPPHDADRAGRLGVVPQTGGQGPPRGGASRVPVLGGARRRRAHAGWGPATGRGRHAPAREASRRL